MDLEDDALLLDWEDDTFLTDFDAGTSSLQSCIDNQKSKLSNQFTSKKKSEVFLKQIDEDLDHAFALLLQAQYDDEVKENADTINSDKSFKNNSKVSKPLSIVDKQWELIDPHPDIHALFIEYDTKFFYGKLKTVEVRWSKRMTLCAGVCCYEGRGGLCSIRLSEPLLKLRPRRDLVETLLHEMIHAYLFVTHNRKDRDAHGPEFLSHMNRINKETGTRITVYHSFHDEVDVYRQHWWKCDGPCKKKRPFFGLVKRAMNRAPGPQDNWWVDHQAKCGGNFIKIKEPDNYSKKKTNKEPDNYSKKKMIKRKNSSASPTDSNTSVSDIRGYLKDNISVSKSNNNCDSKTVSTQPSSVGGLKSVLSKEDNVVTLNKSEISRKKNFIPFQGTGQKLGGSSDSQKGSYRNSLLSSEKIIDVKPLFKTPKIPRVSNSNDVSNFQKDTKPSTSRATTSNNTKSWIQSPMEKFLPPKTAAGASDQHQKIMNYVNHPKVEKNSLKVSCPACFILIKEQEINSHLDKCLLKN